MPVQNTFTLITERIAKNNAAAAETSRPMTSKQLKKQHQKANQGPKLSRIEQRKLELAEQERIRKELEKDRQQARARIARDKKKAKEEAQKEARRKKGRPLVDVRPSQDTISRFVRGNGTGKKRDGSGAAVGRIAAIAEESEGEQAQTAGRPSNVDMPPKRSSPQPISGSTASRLMEVGSEPLSRDVSNDSVRPPDQPLETEDEKRDEDAAPADRTADLPSNASSPPSPKPPTECERAPELPLSNPSTSPAPKGAETGFHKSSSAPIDPGSGIQPCLQDEGPIDSATPLPEPPVSNGLPEKRASSVSNEAVTMPPDHQDDLLTNIDLDDLLDDVSIKDLETTISDREQKPTNAPVAELFEDDFADDLVLTQLPSKFASSPVESFVDRSECDQAKARGSTVPLGPPAVPEERSTEPAPGMDLQEGILDGLLLDLGMGFSQDLDLYDVPELEDPPAVGACAEGPQAEPPSFEGAQFEDDLGDDALDAIDAMLEGCSDPQTEQKSPLPHKRSTASDNQQGSFQNPVSTIPNVAPTAAPDFSSFGEEDLEDDLLRGLFMTQAPADASASVPQPLDTAKPQISEDKTADTRTSLSYAADLGIQRQPSPPRPDPPMSTQAVLMHFDDYFPTPSQQERELEDDRLPFISQKTPCPPPRPPRPQMPKASPHPTQAMAPPPSPKRFFSTSGSNELLSLAVHRSRRDIALENLHDQDRHRIQAGTNQPNRQLQRQAEWPGRSSAAGSRKQTAPGFRHTTRAPFSKRPAQGRPPAFKQARAPAVRAPDVRPPPFKPPAKHPSFTGKENDCPPPQDDVMIASQETEYGGGWIDDIALDIL